MTGNLDPRAGIYINLWESWEHEQERVLGGSPRAGELDISWVDVVSRGNRGVPPFDATQYCSVVNATRRCFPPLYQTGKKQHGSRAPVYPWKQYGFFYLDSTPQRFSQELPLYFSPCENMSIFHFFPEILKLLPRRHSGACSRPPSYVTGQGRGGSLVVAHIMSGHGTGLPPMGGENKERGMGSGTPH